MVSVISKIITYSHWYIVIFETGRNGYELNGSNSRRHAIKAKSYPNLESRIFISMTAGTSKNNLNLKRKIVIKKSTIKLKNANQNN